MLKTRFVWLALALVVMIAPGLASAQTHEALAFVTQALDKLAALESYHFHSDSTVVNEFIDAHEARNAGTTLFVTAGSVQADSDNHTTISISNVDKNPANDVTMEIERIVFEGTLYINISYDDPDYAAYGEALGYKSGWWRYDDLRASLSENLAAGLDIIIKRPLPSTSPALRPDMIASVEERQPDTQDGQAMRVFDLRLDARRLMMEAYAESGTQQLREIFGSLEVLAAGTFHASARVWIGADDGQIYRVQASTKAVIPYLSSGHEDQMPYDLRQTEQVTLTLSEHGQLVEISAPSPLNEP